MKILGIDPGLQKTGWGIISFKDNTLGYIASGLIKTNPKFELCDRLAILHQGIKDVIDEYKPGMTAVEEVFSNKNAVSTLKLGQARGVLLCVPALYGLPVREYGANKVKKSIVGSGHAAKQQMGMMVRTLLPACGDVSEDEADALAVAICCAHHNP